MSELLSQKFVKLLRWSQRYTKTDMIYASKGSFWLLIGRAGIFFVSFVTMMAFARWLPTEAYGTYQFVIAGLGIAGIFALSGMSTALIKSIAQNKEGTLILVIKEKMKWALIGSLGLLLLSVWYLIHQNFLLAGGFLLAAAFLPFIETFALSPTFWNGKKRFDIESKYNVYPAVLTLLILIPTIYFTNNVLLILFTAFATHVVFQGFFLLKTTRQLINNEEDKEAISFGKNLTAMDAVVRVAGHIDKIILWHFLGPAQVAIYSFAQFPVKSLAGILPIQPLALPKLSEGDIKDIKKGLLRKFYLLFLFSVPLTLIIVLAAPLVYQIFFSRYNESVIYFQALSVTLVLTPFSLLGTALISDLRKKDLYVIRIGSAILRIVLFLLLVPLYGIWGIVGGFLITAFLKELLVLYYFNKI